jgi:hypothetical protein
MDPHIIDEAAAETARTSTPRVSVVMPVYNAERFVRMAIESLLQQTYADFELIVIDDGSTDRSREVIASFRDPRIRSFNASHRGVQHVRNWALQLARGEYLACLDADDLASADRLRIQAEFLDQHAEITVVGSAFEVIDEDGGLRGVERPPTDSTTLRWRLLFGNHLGHSTVMYRLEDVRTVGGYGDFAFAEDYDLWRRIAAAGCLINLQEPLVRYRVHSRSATQATSAAAKAERVAEIVRLAFSELNGQLMSAAAARTLSRHGGEPAPSREVFAEALENVAVALQRLAAQTAFSARRRLLAGLAIEDLLRIGAANSPFQSAAYRTALGIAVRYGLLQHIPSLALRWAWTSLTSPALRRKVNGLRSKFRARLAHSTHHHHAS